MPESVVTAVDRVQGVAENRGLSDGLENPTLVLRYNQHGRVHLGSTYICIAQSPSDVTLIGGHPIASEAFLLGKLYVKCGNSKSCFFSCNKLVDPCIAYNFVFL